MVKIFELLSSRSVSRIMSHMLARPSTSFYAARLSREARISKPAVLSSLKRLEKAGILTRAQNGKEIFYSLAQNSAMIKQLKILLTLSSISELVQDAAKAAPEAEIYIFGSSARGEDTEKSDIDLLVVTQAQPSAFSPVFSRAKGLGIRPVFYTSMEYAMLSRKDPAFYERVEKDRIRVL
ncbi:MAG: nucleotidyltransferase domain-containing protein [Candidatus Micrarchaeia archaeon]